MHGGDSAQDLRMGEAAGADDRGPVEEIAEETQGASPLY